MKKSMTLLGIVLIVAGALGLAYGAISYQETEQVADIGPLEVEAQQTEQIPIPPAAGFLSVAAGIGLMLWDRKR